MTSLQPVVLQHLLSMELLTNQDVKGLIQNALAFKKGQVTPQVDQSAIIANLFFENSTRTHKSFEVAEMRMGLQLLDFDAKTSSLSKGETLYDTILTLSALGVEACVIRHGQEDYYEELIASPNITCSIINGGDGSGQHPSQSLLDLMTIYEQFGQFEGLKIAISGDLRHSRVAKSNMQILSQLGAELYFAGPKIWYDPDFDQYGHYTELDDILPDLDVAMFLRVQTERGAVLEDMDQSVYNQQYGLTQSRYQSLKDTAIIMHPAPVNRDVEIDNNLVEAPKSRIVTQMTNGVYMRMAILQAILDYRANKQY